MASNELMNEGYEKCLLGSMLMDNEIIDDVINKISRDQFATYNNQRVFDEIQKQYLENKYVDIMTVSSRIDGVKPGYIVSLTDTVSTSVNYDFYIGEIKKLHAARELKKGLAEKMSSISADNVIDTIHDLDSSLNKFMTLDKAKPKCIKDMCVPFVENLQKLIKTKPEYLGYDSGWTNVNDILDGIIPGQEIIIGARPSVGKTAFSVQMAINLCKKGVQTDYISLEMSKNQLMNRIVSFESGIPIYYLTHGIVDTQGTMTRLNAAINRIFEYPLNIFDERMENEKKLYSYIRTRAKEGCKVFFVDHLGLVRHSNNTMKKVEQLDEITQHLLQLAQELNVTIICLCQLKRDAEGKEPTLSDLRDSGAIEQNADVCMFLHRDRAMNNETEIKSKVIVIKNRNGACGTANMVFYPRMTKFEEDDSAQQAA